MAMTLRADPVEEALRDAARLEVAGDFVAADARLVRVEATPGLGPAAAESVAFERERLRRIRRDFRLTRAQVWEAVRAAIRDVTPGEFERWIHEGRFDVRRIDDAEWFFVSSVSNLFFRDPGLEARRLKPKSRTALQEAYLASATSIREAARREGRPYVLPKTYRMRMTVSLASNAVPAGTPVSAWLPVPRRYPYQDRFELLRTSSPVRALEAEDSCIRSVHLVQPAAVEGATEFEVEYTYRASGVWFDLDPARSRPIDPADPALRPWLGEAPHVRFTPAMRRLAAEVGGTETNAVRRARQFHRWIAEEFRYSYAPEYSTIRDLAESCRASRRGDCGQLALLFITLCRISGIPARWQSGWAIFPGDETIHDWCEIHLAPWGWVPVDPYMGLYAMRYATALPAAEREALRDFYFGGLSQHRMAANSDHNQELRPTRHAPRSDPVDFQRGELEAGGRNLYFDVFDYDLKWEEVPAGATP